MATKRKSKKIIRRANHPLYAIVKQVDRLRANGSMAKFEDSGVAAMAMRSDGYMFYAVHTETGELRIWAGCQHDKTVSEYKKHVRNDYPRSYGNRRWAKAKQKETWALLDFLVLSANATWCK